jgi:hypothetical protein
VFRYNYPQVRSTQSAARKKTTPSSGVLLGPLPRGGASDYFEWV